MTLVLEDSYDFKKIKALDSMKIDDSMILILDPKSKNFSKNLLTACSDGFKYPVMSSKVFDRPLEYPHLCLYLRYDHNIGVKNKEWKKTLASVKFVLKNFIDISDSTNCGTWITLDKKSVDYMQDYTKKHRFRIDGGTSEQREITGRFICTPGWNLKGFSGTLITVDEKFSDVGQAEEAGYFDTVASFHTHPHDAYKKYSVCAAWPSVDDYLTILTIYSEGYGVFHIVSTIEGMYVITISDTLLQLPRETIKEDFGKYEKSINEHYRVDYPTNCNNPKKYVDKYIEEINKKPYFVVKFVEWKNATKPIEIIYKKVNGNCLLSDEQVRLSQNLRNLKFIAPKMV